MNRRKRIIITLAALFLLLVSLPLGWQHWQKSQCYDQIRVGGSAKEASAILEGRGYRLTGGGVNSGEFVMVFTRDGTSARIILIEDMESTVTKKEFDSAIEGFRNFIRHFVF